MNKMEKKFIGNKRKMKIKTKTKTKWKKNENGTTKNEM